MNQNRCRHCHTFFLPNPRIKKQRYCNRPECQRARKALWQKQKMLQDPDYQTTHHEAQKTWMEQQPRLLENLSSGTSRLSTKKPPEPAKPGSEKAFGPSCKDGRVKAFFFHKTRQLLPGPRSCKDGLVSSKSIPYSGYFHRSSPSCKEGLDRPGFRFFLS